jgi:hypothetical protein
MKKGDRGPGEHPEDKEDSKLPSCWDLDIVWLSPKAHVLKFDLHH